MVVVTPDAGATEIQIHTDRGQNAVSASAAGDFQHLLVLASDGMDVYTLNVANGLYEQYDDVPHDLIETFVTFDDLMNQILARSQPAPPTAG